MAENSVSILFVGDGFPVPLHSSLFTASPNPFGRFSRLLREAKRLPYALTNWGFAEESAAPNNTVIPNQCSHWCGNLHQISGCLSSYRLPFLYRFLELFHEKLFF